MDAMQVPMTAGLKRFLERQATKKGFRSPGDYVKAVLSDLQKKEELEDKLREGLRSQKMEANEAFWRELENEILEEHPELK